MTRLDFSVQACLQVVLSDEGVRRFGPGISDLSNVEVVGYNTSGVDELDLRQAVREEKRAVGFGSIKKTFGLPLHSHPLVQNTEVHDKIKVVDHVRLWHFACCAT